jgi:phosphoglycerol transferase
MMEPNSAHVTDSRAEKPEGKNRKTAGHILLMGLHVLLTVLPVAACGAAIYLHAVYPNEKLEELWFYLTNGAGDSGASTFLKGAAIVGPPCLVIIVLLLLLQYDVFGKRRTIRRKSQKSGREKEIQLYPIRHKWIFTAAVFVIFIGIGCQQIGVYTFVAAQFRTSEFIQDHYVDPRGTSELIENDELTSESDAQTAETMDNIWDEYSNPGYLVKAPEKLRNLLVIEVESLETTMFTKKQGGAWDYEVIPEMYDLLHDEDAIFFASDSGTRGTQDGYGSTWTTASMIANTAGIPFKVPVGMNNSYHSKNFLKGAYALGDVLRDFGYRNVLISACRTSFGGVAEYFTCHGNYEIIDPNNLRFKTGAETYYSMEIPKSQKNEWGFSDEFTFDVAKKFLSTQSGADDQPWHLFISTIDTHFTGYTYEADEDYKGSETKFNRQLENVYATTSRSIAEFVQWVKKQPFYENTTIVIIGDHVNMLKSFCDKDDDDLRGRYNLILNSVVSTANTKNRSFTAFDFYPTMLAAAGFTIGGDRLGLGANLFSSRPTLAETYELSYMNAELEKKSDFYIDYIMGREDYEELESKAEKENE